MYRHSLIPALSFVQTETAVGLDERMALSVYWSLVFIKAIVEVVFSFHLCTICCNANNVSCKQDFLSCSRHDHEWLSFPQLQKRYNLYGRR